MGGKTGMKPGTAFLLLALYAMSAAVMVSTQINTALAAPQVDERRRGVFNESSSDGDDSGSGSGSGDVSGSDSGENNSGGIGETIAIILVAVIMGVFILAAAGWYFWGRRS